MSSTQKKAGKKPQSLEVHLDAEQKAKRRRIPVVVSEASDRCVAVVPLVGHFCIEGELFCDHIIGAPTETSGKGVAGADSSAGVFSKTVHVDPEAHVDIRAE